MASVNKWIGVGNLGRDPEIRTFPSGDKVANVTIACTDRWKDKQTGEQKEHTEWVRLVFNGPLAGIVEKYLRKGMQIYVEGAIRTRKWTDQSGQERYTTEIRADTMQMLGSKQNGGGDGGDDHGGDHYNAPAPAPARAPAPRPPAPPPQTAASGFDDDGSDIPF